MGIYDNNISDISVLETLTADHEYTTIYAYNNYLNLTEGSRTMATINAVKDRVTGWFVFDMQKPLSQTPFDAKAQAKGISMVELSWDYMPDTVYEVTRTGGGETKTILTNSVNTGYADTVLTPGTVYSYTVKAHIWQGEGKTPVTVEKTVTVKTDKGYVITASAGEGGSISPSGEVSVPENGSVTFIIDPNAGYRIASVIVDGEDKGAKASYTFEDVKGPHNIRAVFKRVNSRRNNDNGDDNGGGTGDDPTPRTLVDNSTGATVSGSISEGAVFTIEELTLGSSDADNIIRAWIQDDEHVMIWSGNISITGSFTGTLTISLPVGEQYNGQTVLILHAKQDGTLETYTVEVKDGKATFEVTSLSPFAVFIVNGADDIPKTGDEPGNITKPGNVAKDTAEAVSLPKAGNNSSSWAWWLLLAIPAVGIGLLLFKLKKANSGR